LLRTTKRHQKLDNLQLMKIRTELKEARITINNRIHWTYGYVKLAVITNMKLFS